METGTIKIRHRIIDTEGYYTSETRTDEVRVKVVKRHPMKGGGGSDGILTLELLEEFGAFRKGHIFTRTSWSFTPENRR